MSGVQGWERLWCLEQEESFPVAWPAWELGWEVSRALLAPLPLVHGGSGQHGLLLGGLGKDEPPGQVPGVTSTISAQKGTQSCPAGPCSQC